MNTNDKIPEEVVPFFPGDRQEAIRQSVEIVKKKCRSAELIICRDILGHHTGGEDCFCDPKIIIINEKGEILDE